MEATLANSKQAAKRARQNTKRRMVRKWQMTRMMTQIKRVVQLIEAKDLEQAKTTYQVAVSFIDKLANKGIIHKNKAARHKSRLNQHIKALANA